MPLPDSPPLVYEAALASVSRWRSENLRSGLSPFDDEYVHFAPTTSMPDAPGTLTGGTPTSDAVRNGEVSGGYSNSNPNPEPDAWPATNAFGNGMDLPNSPYSRVLELNDFNKASYDSTMPLVDTSDNDSTMALYDTSNYDSTMPLFEPSDDWPE